MAKPKIMLRLYIVTWFTYAPDDEKSELTEIKTGRRISVFSGALQASSVGDVEKIVFENIVPKFNPYKVTVAPTGYISAGLTKKVSHETIVVYDKRQPAEEANADESKEQS